MRTFTHLQHDLEASALRVELARRGLTHRELGLLAGISAKTVSQILGGHNRFHRSRWRINQALGIEIFEIPEIKRNYYEKRINC